MKGFQVPANFWGDDFFDHKVPVRLNRDPWWERLLHIALYLLFFDIFFRRVILSLTPVKNALAYLSRRRESKDETTTQLLGTLLEKREELKSRGPKSVIEVRDPVEGEELVAADGEPVAKKKRVQEAPQDSFTDRLLKAKKRAHGDE